MGIDFKTSLYAFGQIIREELESLMYNNLRGQLQAIRMSCECSTTEW